MSVGEGGAPNIHSHGEQRDRTKNDESTRPSRGSSIMVVAFRTRGVQVHWAVMKFELDLLHGGEGHVFCRHAG